MAANDTAAASPGLDLLLNRRSESRLTDPGPSDADLVLMLKATLRAPDFQRLRPYRFLLASGEGLARLGQAMQRAAVAARKSAEVIDRAPRMPLRAPLVIVVISSPRPSTVVPLIDQQLCAGCTVLLLQLAAQALGYGGIWRSGWMATDPVFHGELGLQPGESIVGFLYVGTPKPKAATSQCTSATSTSSAEIPEGVVAWM